jgi:hypothetical protein
MAAKIPATTRQNPKADSKMTEVLVMRNISCLKQQCGYASALPASRPMLHTFSIPRRKRLGVRQPAAAFMPHLLGIEWINRAFKEGASQLAHSKGFAFSKNYAAIAGTSYKN